MELYIYVCVYINITIEIASHNLCQILLAASHSPACMQGEGLT